MKHPTTSQAPTVRVHSIPLFGFVLAVLAWFVLGYPGMPSGMSAFGAIERWVILVLILVVLAPLSTVLEIASDRVTRVRLFGLLGTEDLPRSDLAATTIGPSNGSPRTLTLQFRSGIKVRLNFFQVGFVAAVREFTPSR